MKGFVLCVLWIDDSKTLSLRGQNSLLATRILLAPSDSKEKRFIPVAASELQCLWLTTVPPQHHFANTQSCGVAKAADKKCCFKNANTGK